ncbi:2Fe-2S iron-sulfur cluster binding domain-containing protein [Variovorax sp. 38R]|uniref:2Fe-2S iron-sulfur cluster binding domain-containing protein n=1 Tax=Variovorax sp. 38R TaxID=2774875 RepID=UPI00178592BB|nr:2Fe-2S iron-sulfur cluster binding domain-containing protein [Variovorax sp. 38R]QOF80338.1 2Fe-2S iron-sulfur cluster binding domain-containing protein [Variovorax sp. 38R]
MSFSVVIGNTHERYSCRADQTLLSGMEQLGRKGIPVGCRGGGCGVCKVRIESGAVRRERMSRCHVSVEEEAQGYVLACRAYPQSDLALRAVEKLARCIERRLVASASPSSDSRFPT